MSTHGGCHKEIIGWPILSSAPPQESPLPRLSGSSDGRARLPGFPLLGRSSSKVVLTTEIAVGTSLLVPMGPRSGREQHHRRWAISPGAKRPSTLAFKRCVVFNSFYSSSWCVQRTRSKDIKHFYRAKRKNSERADICFVEKLSRGERGRGKGGGQEATLPRYITFVTCTLTKFSYYLVENRFEKARSGQTRRRCSIIHHCRDSVSAFSLLRTVLNHSKVPRTILLAVPEFLPSP